jgi:copper chaperone CopZ
MTCENCARHVRSALLELPGVRSAEVDLSHGSATIEADAQPSREALASVLEDAGYELG